MRSFTSLSCAVLLASTSIRADYALAFPTGARGSPMPSAAATPASGSVSAGGSGANSPYIFAGLSSGLTVSRFTFSASKPRTLADSSALLCCQGLFSSTITILSLLPSIISALSGIVGGVGGSLGARSVDPAELESFFIALNPFFGTLTGDDTQGDRRPAPSPGGTPTPSENALPGAGDAPGTDISDGADPVPGAAGILGERPFRGF